MFQNILIRYLNEAQCNIKTLAERSDLPQSSICRYINGSRVPQLDNDIIEKLASALSAMIYDPKNKEGESEEELEERIGNELRMAVRTDKEQFPFEEFSRNLNLLIKELGLSQNEVARRIYLSGATLSRIISGIYRTRDPEGIINRVTDLVADCCKDDSTKERLRNLLMREVGTDCSDEDAFFDTIKDWLAGKYMEDSQESSDSLVSMLNDFDLNEYLKGIDLGKIVVPRTRWKIPTTKKYVGRNGMEKGVEDFLKATATSTSVEDVFLFSNHPIEYLVDNQDVYQRIVKALGLVLLQKHKICVIHNTNRPMKELMLAIEGWVPLYMSGLVESYYTDGGMGGMYQDILMVSGSAMFQGRGIAGKDDMGQYVLSKAKTRIAEARLHADTMLSQCKPLVRVYGEDEYDEFLAEFEGHLEDKDPIRNLSLSLPLETMDEKLLVKILKRHGVDDATRKRVVTRYRKKREILEELVANCPYQEIITTSHYDSELPLSIPQWNCDYNLTYLPDEWEKHLESTKRFAEEHENYVLEEHEAAVFDNLTIHVRKNSYAIIDRYKGSEQRFVFYHPRLVRSFYNLEEPVFVDIPEDTADIAG